MENRFYIPFLLSYLDALIHIGFHAWISFEIAVDQFFGFLPVYVHSLCKAEYGDAVDDTEVGGFRFASHIGVYVFQADLIYFGSCSRMDIVIAEEGVDHILVFAEMGHDTEFYLRIVGREEQAAFVRDKCLADFLAVLVADRDILQIRVTGAEASGRGDGLVERRVYTSCARVDQLGKCVDIRAQ